jgi:UDP-N-acetyl-D-glucosamine dehydrogenase
MFARDLDIDVWEAIEAASSKPFGYMKFTPGPGVGGHCLPIDPSYLSWRVMRSLGRSFRFVELANDVNDHMPDYVIQRVSVAFNRERRAVNGSDVLLIGLAYKRNTGDARESPSLIVAARLLDLGASVSACDPYVSDEQLDSRIRRVELSTAELEKADAVVILTDHDHFDFALIAEHARFVLDTRHRLPAGANIEYL